MEIVEKFQVWLSDNNVEHSFLNPRVANINNENYLLLDHKKQKIFNSQMALIIDESELDLLDDFQIDYFVTLFGDRFYYFGESDFITSSVFNEVGEAIGEEMFVHSLNELRYIGNCIEQAIPFPMLGVHGGYDLCNGTRSYKDWCRKASWLGVDTLGICEENTLAGTLLFQTTCQKFKINSVIGETVVVQHNSSLQYHVKIYVESIEGWRNLCQINSIINTSSKKSIDVQSLLQLQNGLIFVLTPTIPISAIYEQFQQVDQLYYQLDFTEWNNAIKDEEWLDNLFEYLSQYRDRIQPIALFDSYYLEKQEADIQPILWRIGKRESFKYRSSDRYFKSSNEYIRQAINLFDNDSEAAIQVIELAIENAQKFKDIQFIIPTGEKHLPVYELTEEQKQQFADPEELFWFLIDKGLQEKVIEKGLDAEIYLNRIQEEVRVIELGQVRDYFLIVWDMLNFCREKGIRTGYGRGSAAGCLVSYLLGIVHVDPIQYDLLFERFLNESRMGKLTEIDIVTINSNYYLKITDDVQVSRNGQILNLKAISLQQEDIILNEEILRKM